MLTNIEVRNFKRFSTTEVELGNPVVFIGPNNSGKTTMLQALALWDIGVKRWLEKRGGTPTPEKRPGVTINRRDLLTVPVPSSKLLWRDLHVRDAERINEKTRTKNVLIEVVVHGVDKNMPWVCGMEFDYANEESFYCRPLRGEHGERMPVPDAARTITVAFLPPMSGLASDETRLDPGAIQVRLGEGKTAEVLRNLCYLVTQQKGEQRWERIVERIRNMFGVVLEQPFYIPERGEITMSYRERKGTSLDLSASGRGLQQTLLLLAYLTVNPRSVILIDEPDAHLEILRQREIYRVLTESASEQGSQIVIASHSEVVLNEAADRDVVVAFVGRPHRIDDRSQVVKSLKEIGFEQYYLAEQRGWILYLEGATDLSILQSFAELLQHPASEKLARPFVHYIENQPQKARDHFYGLREGKKDLFGLVVTDRLDKIPQQGTGLREWMWKRREIENYLCQRETLLRFAEAGAAERAPGPLFAAAETERSRATMEEIIEDLVPPVALRDPGDEWWSNIKASDEFLDRLFARYYQRLKLPNLMRKSDYHRLTVHVPVEQIDHEVIELLDWIVEVGDEARPRDDGSE